MIARRGVEPGKSDLLIHGTTLATNALIERKGAKTALLTTEGFRDVVEIRHENRFEQYDVNIDLPPPLVPRRLRVPVRERIDAQGKSAGAARCGQPRPCDRVIASQQVEAVAVGLLHSFTNPDHERRVGDAIARRLPQRAGDALIRGLAGDARIRALLHRLRQCLHPAADGALPRRA